MQYVLLASSRIAAVHRWTPTHVTCSNDGATTFGCIAPTNAARRFCVRLILSRGVQACWFVLTCLSTAVALAIQPRYDMGSATYATLFAVQVVCLVFFWGRMVAEVIANGLVEAPRGFLRSVWNWMELVVNVFGLLQVIPPTFRIRWMRSFAAARPLRFFIFVPWWRQHLVPLGRVFPRLFDVMATLGLCLTALALIGVMTVGAALQKRCYITATAPSSPYSRLTLPFRLRNISAACGTGLACPVIAPDTTVQCLSLPAAPHSHIISYENAGTALLLMFKVASMDMWFENVEEVMTVRGPDAALYLVVVALVALFFFSLFTSVVYNAYARFDAATAAPPLAGGGAAARQQRHNCGVQTRSVRASSRSQTTASRGSPSQRLAHSGEWPGEDNDDDDDGERWGRGNPLCGSGASAVHGQSAEDVSAGPAASGRRAAAARDFFRDLAVTGFWAALRGLEVTTTAGPGAAPRVPLAAALVDSLVAVVLFMLVSLVNIILLASASASQSDTARRVMHLASAALSIACLVPVVLRLIAFGVVRTAVDAWNYVDVMGAVSGLLELAAPSIFAYRAVCVLRVLRYVRVAKYLSPLYHYQYRIKSLGSLLLLATATLALYALLGMQLFADTFVATATSTPVQNGDFSTVWTALLACFRAFTGDVWTRYMVAVGEHGTVATAALFFVSLQLFSHVMLFALGNSIILLGSRDAARDVDAQRSAEFPPLLLLPPLSHAEGTAADMGPTASRWRWRRRVAWGTRSGPVAEKLLRVRGNAFLLLDPANAVRLLLLRVLGSLSYTVASTLCVLLGTIALFFERRRLDAGTARALHIVNILYAVLFGLEMLVKWVAYGVLTPGGHSGEDSDREGRVEYMPAYFRHPLNWVDFVANVLSFAAIAYPPLRAGRAIRAVRLCTTQERPNTAFLELVKVLRHTCRVAPLIVFLYVAFAVAGMQMFAGGLDRCTDAAVVRQSSCTGRFNTTVVGYTGNVSVEAVRQWVRPPFHYDAFGPALLSVLAMTTVNHWGAFMDDVMAVGDPSASYNHAGYYVLFPIAALLLIRFFAVRTIAAVLVAELRRVLMESMGTTQRTQHQTRFVVSRECICYMAGLQRLLPPLPNRVSRLCHRILSARPPHWPNTAFRVGVLAVLVVVCGFVAATHVGEALWQQRMVLGVYCVAVAVCGLEVLLAFLAYGARHLRRMSYVADVVLVALLVIGAASSTLRFLRVCVFVKLMKDASTGLTLLPAVRHIRVLLSAGALGLFVLFTYAVVGTVLLGNIAPDGVYLTERRNFSTVIGSLLVLFDCSTFDQWHRVMHACFDGAACRDDPSATCGHTPNAVVFFVSFIVIESLVVAQLIFAAMVMTFTVPLFVDVIDPFVAVRRAWETGIGAGECACDFNAFLALLPRLPASLTDGITCEGASEADVIAFLSSLRLPLDEHLRLRYKDLLRGFGYRRYRIDLTDRRADAHARDRPTCLTAGEYYAQLVRRKFCDDVSRRAQATMEGVGCLDSAALASSPPHTGVGTHDVLRRHGDDLLVPKGALPIPSSNVFLYTFPGESNDVAGFTTAL
ncbi:Ion transport protein [Novymonas esmeraldas]|uniref:Ion transport protein n=1 Tax=Novymonas esmeraldas TaxID=1808958 RepID=A0AAW0ES74_9TRYP